MSNGKENDGGEHASGAEDCGTAPTSHDSDAGVKRAVINGDSAQATLVMDDDPFAAFAPTPVQMLDPHLFGGGFQDALPTNSASSTIPNGTPSTTASNDCAVEPPPPGTNDHELLDVGDSLLDVGDSLLAPVMTESAPTISDTDVDFGDFERLENPKSDDSFGAFDEAPSTVQPAIDAAPTTEPDDSFGEFDLAPSPAEVAAPEPSQVADDPADVGTQDEVASNAFPEDDDFDDFGDFNEAVETAEVTPPLDDSLNSDGFGDFGEASESTPLASESVSEFNDPLIDRARVVFEHVFGPRSEVDEIDVGTSEEDVQESATLEDILAQMRAGLSESQTVAPDWAIEKLSSKSGILKVIEPSARSVIFDPSASHPYSHFSRPAQSPILNRSGERKEKRWSSFDLSERHGVQNPIGSWSVSGSADETEIVDGHGGSSAAATVTSLPAGVKLDFTNFEAPSERGDSGNGAGIKSVSTTAQLFLRQVPDLSFMLTSKLDLLKK